MTVLELKTRPKEVAESVIATLEELLERAREGDVVQVAVATVASDGAVGCSWSEIEDFGKILGSVVRLQHRMNVKADKE